MSNENAPARYHPVHVALHWLIAVMVIGAILGAVFMLGGPNSPEEIPALKFHAIGGGLLAVLLIARIVTRFMLKRPAPADAGHPLLNFAANAVHVLLYIAVSVMLFSGAGNFMFANLAAVFGGQADLPKDFFIYPSRTVHGLIYYALSALILMHVGAALYHQFVRKDNLLGRMWFGK